MKAAPSDPSIIVVESGKPLPRLLYDWLAGSGLEVLGPTDDFYDAYRLARDRRPRLAIIDMRIGGDCRRHIRSLLAPFHVACFELSVSACRRRQDLSALENAIAPLRGSDARNRPLVAAASLRPGLWASTSRVDRTLATAYV